MIGYTGGRGVDMEVGTTIVKTEEYIELRYIKDSLEARRLEIERKAQMILINEWGRPSYVSNRFISKDDAIQLLDEEIERLKGEKKEMKREMDKLCFNLQEKAKKQIDSSLKARFVFLFTGKTSDILKK